MVPIPRGLIGGFLGLIIGVVLAFVIERVDTRLQTKEDTELAFDLPVLAEVPPLTRSQRSDTEVLSYTHPMSRTAEAYRALRSSLVFLRQTVMPAADGDGRKSQVIMITSAGPAEGKTTTVANLATVFAEADYSVLVVNCDFRRPRLHRYLGGSDESRKVVQSDVPGVRMVNNVLSSTNANPAEVTATQRRVIEAARGIFDIILLDTAPLLSTNDASELISVSDLVVLVARSGRTTRPTAQRATEVLQRLEATVAGVALIGTKYVPSAQYYYYATEDGATPTAPTSSRTPSICSCGPTTWPTGGPTGRRPSPPVNRGPTVSDSTSSCRGPSRATPSPPLPRTNDRAASGPQGVRRLLGAARSASDRPADHGPGQAQAAHHQLELVHRRDGADPHRDGAVCDRAVGAHPTRGCHHGPGPGDRPHPHRADDGRPLAVDQGRARRSTCGVSCSPRSACASCSPSPGSSPRSTRWSTTPRALGWRSSSASSTS